MVGRFDWWQEWMEQKNKYARTEEVQMNESKFNASAIGTGLPHIYQQSTFKFHNVEEGANRFLGMSPSGEKPFARVYTRLGNPTTEYLEKVMFKLECDHIIQNALNADEENPTIGVFAFSSGMAAISSTILGFVKPGDGLVVGNVYGSTDSFVRWLSDRFGVDIYFTDTTNSEEVRQKFEDHDNIVAVILESPANPTLELSDIKAISKITEKHEAILIADNTFATPFLQQPFRLGADIVIHSMTKYINGHSTSIGGMALGPYVYFSNDLFHVYKDLGPTPSPFDSWLNSTSIQDIGLRVKAQSLSAAELASNLENNENVDHVYYPGLKSHPQYNLCKDQMRLPGGMIAFDLKGGFDAGIKLMNYFAQPDTPMELAVSLGSVVSYIEHPASMTHSVIPEPDRAKRGISDSLVRLSVGAEGTETLWKYLQIGLELAHKS